MYAIDVAVLTHIRYYAAGSRRIFLTAEDKEKAKESPPEVNADDRAETKSSGTALRQLVALSRYWGFPHVYIVFGIIAVIELVLSVDTHSLARFAFVFYAFSYPLWTVAFLTRVLSNKLIDREVESLIEKIELLPK
jgi:uncharacterized integral membrane protein